MQIIPRTFITISSERQRSDIAKPALMELVDSIKKLGLLHPPVFAHTGENLYQLVAGGRRMAAIDYLAKEKITFFCDGIQIEPNSVPITISQATSRIERAETELDENIIREDLSWQDRVRALAKLHELRSELNPKQTQKETAIEIAAKSGNTTDVNVNRLRNEVQRASAIAKLLDSPSVAKARNETEAYQIALAEESTKYTAALIKRKTITAENNLRCSVRHGDALEIMPKMDDAQFDLILSDPPYGLDAGAAGYRARTALHHNYNDSFDNARVILKSILLEGWRLTKPKANIILFTDIQHFQYLYDAAKNMAWTPWRYPIIWQKSTSEGLVPWGRHGFVHVYDVIFFATKGQKGTNATNVDILNYPRVARNERIYAAEKPIPLLSRLIELTTVPGDVVFDPCAGSGSTLLAAKELKRHSLGIEYDEKVCNLATVRINQGDAHADFSILPELNLNGDTSTVPE